MSIVVTNITGNFKEDADIIGKMVFAVSCRIRTFW